MLAQYLAVPSQSKSNKASKLYKWMPYKARVQLKTLIKSRMLSKVAFLGEPAKEEERARWRARIIRKGREAKVKLLGINNIRGRIHKLCYQRKTMKQYT